MPLIGRFLKQTTALSYRKNAKKTQGYNEQVKVLQYLLSKSKTTKFGLAHNFSAILSKEMVRAYQQEVPIMDYDSFYNKWLKYSILGEKDNTWRGRIKYYALSSGTTGSPSKRIPVTSEMIRSFQKSSLRQLSILHSLDLPQSFYSTTVLTVGGSTKLAYKETHVEGDLSGILKKHTSFIASPFTKPGARISGVKDWNKKLDLMVEKAPKWDVGIIAGIPSWCIMLLERIIERHKLDSIHDIWPNLYVYVHGGVFMDPYVKRLNQLVNREIDLLDTYLASEGYFAYQEDPARKGMKLLLNNGIFFEFVPFTADNFDEEGTIKKSAAAYTIEQVQEGVDYALVISTNAGLWRYLIGDLVRFTNTEENELVISGRIRQFLSLCGEHLSLENINDALLKTSSFFNIDFSEFTIYADVDKHCHCWYLGTNKNVDDPKAIISFLDDALRSANDDYNSARKYTLKAPEIKIVSPAAFYGYMAKVKKLGSQNKMPRVLNKKQAKTWLDFINAS